MGKQTFGQLSIFEPMQNFAGGGETVRVEIYGAIGWDIYAPDFLEALNELPDSVTDIDLRIHSYGGVVTEGWAIANALKNHKATVTGTIEGTAASMASVIAMSCDRLVMPKNAYLMIHRVSGGAFGNAEDVENGARFMKQLEDDVVQFYADKTGMESEEIRDMMAAVTWMNGEQALEKGFCHEVIAEVKAVALVGERNVVEAFGELPVAIAQANGLGTTEETEETEGGEGASGDLKPSHTMVGPDGAPVMVVDQEPVLLPVIPDAPEGYVLAVSGTGVPSWVKADVTETSETDAGNPVSRVLASMKNLFGANADGRAQNVAALTAENHRLIAEVETLTADRDGAVKTRDEYRERLQTLEADARSVEAVIAECGFSAADADELPVPSNDDGDASKDHPIDVFRAMPMGDERSAYFKAHKDEILAEEKRRARPVAE